MSQNKYMLERRDHEDGSCHYEIMLTNPPSEYRCICTFDEDVEKPGQALTDARMVLAAIDGFKNAHEAFLSLFADSLTWEIEYDADMTSTGRQVDCSTFHIGGPLELLRELCKAFGIESKHEQSLEDAINEAVVN